MLSEGFKFWAGEIAGFVKDATVIGLQQVLRRLDRPPLELLQILTPVQSISQVIYRIVMTGHDGVVVQWDMPPGCSLVVRPGESLLISVRLVTGKT